ncbi:hypothetical protein KCU99_g182, partial [Aureobasidium melanogenum]
MGGLRSLTAVPQRPGPHIFLTALCTAFTPGHFSASEQDTNAHDNATKSYADICSVRLPSSALGRKHWWRQRAQTRCPDRRSNEMAIWVKGLMGEIVEVHDLPADEGF